MAFTNTRAVGLTLAVAAGLFAFQKENQSSLNSSTATEYDTPAIKHKSKPLKRRQRVGPKTPPENWEKRTKHNQSEGDLSEPPQGHTDGKRAEQQEKLRDYLEHLEVLDNPNPDELTLLGEMAFDANQADDAYDHYLEVIEEHTDDPNAVFALYKLAWTEYNLGDVEAAIEDMKLVIEWTQNGTLRMEHTIGEAAHDDLKIFSSELE